MIRSGYGNRVNLFVLKQLANIDEGFGPWQASLLDFAEALVHHVFVDIAKSGNLCVWHTRVAVDVVIAAAPHSANGYTHAVIRAQNARVA
jgi:hypothetical protein